MTRARLLLFLLLATTTFATARPLDLPAPSERWITLRVDEFTFVSNASPSRTRSIARDVLSMRDAVRQVTDLKVRSSKPTRIFIFASEQAFAPYREALMPQKKTIRGMFQGAAAGNFIVIKSDGQTDVDRVVYHELTHYFVNNTMAGLPLWADEGMAEYFSKFRTSGDFVEIGWPIEEHLQWLRRGKLELIPLRDFMAATADSPLYNGDSRQGLFHRQSWALYHYLRADHARSAQLSKFLGLVVAGRPIDDAFTSAFQKSYADLERELRAYVRGPKFAYVAYPLNPREIPEVPKAEPMSRDALLYEFGHLLAHAAPDRRADAQRFLAEALKANPRHSGAHADIGWLHYMAGRRKEADASFARALQLGNDDALVHLLIGVSALQDFANNPNDDDAARQSRLKAREALRRSVAVNPNFALAWVGIGVTYADSNDDPAPGIEALEKAAALTPGDPKVAASLVKLYVRAGRRADAQHLIDTVLARSGKREMVIAAREVLLRDEERKVAALATSGKTEEAAEVARSIAARTTDPSLKAHLESVIVRLDAVTKTNRGIKAINEAIMKANAGRVAEALAIIDGALPDITDPAILRQANELRAGLASRVKKR